MPDLGLDPCPECEGRGGSEEIDTGPDGTHITVLVPCPVCGGEGVVERDMSDYEYEKRRDERSD